MIDKKVFETMSSKSLGHAAYMAKSCPLDVRNPEDVKSALATTVLEVAKAVDAGRIKIEDEEAKAFLHGLMSVGMNILFDGEVKIEEANMH